MVFFLSVLEVIYLDESSRSIRFDPKLVASLVDVNCNTVFIHEFICLFVSLFFFRDGHYEYY